MMLRRFGAREPVLMNRLHLESGGGYRNVHMSTTARVHTCAHAHTHTETSACKTSEIGIKFHEKFCQFLSLGIVLTHTI